MTDVTEWTRLQTDKRHLDKTRIVSGPLPVLEPGEALLAIDRIALTANNITYAAFGDAPTLRYWSFFPTGDEAFGHMPAWGFANVVHSTVAGLESGERFYGYWPLATHLVVRPIRVTERGFYDGVPWRLDLTSAYNQYQRVRTDGCYREAFEDHLSVLRPLFITSFMLADFLADNAYFGATQLVVSSASSKTAYGTVYCLPRGDEISSIGLTSSRNRDFVDALGCYDRAASYEDIPLLDRGRPTVYVDFSGDSKIRSAVHEHFGSNLVYDCYAGSAHSHDYGAALPQGLPGPKPIPYFAPTQIKKRNKDWGPAEVSRRADAALLGFIERVADPERPWLEIREHRGLEAAQDLIRALVSGSISPHEGHVVRIG